MSYIDNNLLAGETILFRTGKHPVVFLIPSILLLLAIIAYAANPLQSSLNFLFSPLSHSVFLVYLPAYVFALAALYVALQQTLVYFTCEYAVTNFRIIMKEGFFARYVTDTRLSTISHVAIDQPLLGQLLNYGTITINGFGGSKDAFNIVGRPNQFQQTVQTQLLALGGRKN